MGRMIRFTMSGLWPLTFSSRYMQSHAPQDPGKISSPSQAAALCCLFVISWILMISQLSFELMMMMIMMMMMMMLLLMIHVIVHVLLQLSTFYGIFHSSRTAGSDGLAPRLVQLDREDRRGLRIHLGKTSHQCLEHLGSLLANLDHMTQ